MMMASYDLSDRRMAVGFVDAPGNIFSSLSGARKTDATSLDHAFLVLLLEQVLRLSKPFSRYVHANVLRGCIPFPKIHNRCE